MRKAPSSGLAQLVAATAFMLVSGGCASILGIGEQTFDGLDGGEGGSEADQTTPDASTDSGGHDDGPLAESSGRSRVGGSMDAAGDSRPRRTTGAPAMR